MGKKRWMVIPRDTTTMEKGIKIGSGKKSFKGKTAMYVSDPAEAREIETQYGRKGDGSVLVHEDEKVSRFVRNDKSDIHNYFFSVPDTSHLKRKTKSEYVWVWRGSKQVRVHEDELLEDDVLVEENNANRN